MPTVFSLIKFCEKERYAERFLAGCMHMNRLSHFIQLENDEQRSDSFEGISSWMQPDQVQVYVGGQLIKDIIRPITIRKKQHETSPILCLYAIESGPYQAINEANIIEFKRYLRIREVVNSFGGHAALITNVSVFLERFISAAKHHGFGIDASLVNYYSDLSHNPRFDRPAFYKSDKYADQREYRIVLDIGDDLKTPFTLEIGDLSDIAVKTTTHDLLRNGVDIILPGIE